MRDTEGLTQVAEDAVEAADRSIEEMPEQFQVLKRAADKATLEAESWMADLHAFKRARR